MSASVASLVPLGDVLSLRTAFARSNSCLAAASWPPVGLIRDSASDESTCG